MPSPHQLSRRRRRTQATEPPAGRPATGTGPETDTDADTDAAEAVAAPPDASGKGSTAATRGDPAPPAGAGARRWRPPLPAVLGVLTVMLGGLAVWSGLEAQGLRGGAAARNVALTDNARTSEVKGAVASAVNAIFSCNYADLGRTDGAARRLLTGRAVQQYATLFAPVRQRAPKDKLVLTTTVTDSGVTMLQGDRARVLIFADQRNTRAVDGQTTYAAAMLAVNAVRRDGTWKIDNIDTLTAPPTGEPPARQRFGS
jgi:Mce-associated membrane protein